MENINKKNMIINNFNFNDIPRCPNCNLICSLSLNYKEGIIKYKCENNHFGDLLFDDYMTLYNKYSILKEKCSNCDKNQNETKGDFFFCTKCLQFLCNSCQINHPNGINHNIINFKRYDALCKEHSNFYDNYCIKCEKNLCIYCKDQHINHHLIDLSQNNFSKEIQNQLHNIKIFLESKLKELNILIQQFNSILKNMTQRYNLFKIYSNLISTYEFEETQNNLNYNIINNLKNFNKIYESNSLNSFELINQEYKNLLSISKSFQNEKRTKRDFLFKELKTHKDWICYLHKLKDGRLVSCSGDKTLKIYNKDTFEVELTINEHSNSVISFTELKNGKIITCSADKTMMVFKLINKDEYEIEQILTGNDECIFKVIEIRDNELISISFDKIMKVWILDKDNRFFCYLNIYFQNTNSWCNILKLNEKEFVTSSVFDKCLKFWNSNNYSIIVKVNNIETASDSRKNMCLLQKNILCVGGDNSNGFYLINLIEHQIIKYILGPKRIYSIEKSVNDTLICSIIDENNDNSLIIYNYKDEKFEIIEINKKAHSKFIYSCIELDNGIIASGGNDNLIKLWKATII